MKTRMTRDAALEKLKLQKQIDHLSEMIGTDLSSDTKELRNLRARLILQRINVQEGVKP